MESDNIKRLNIQAICRRHGVFNIDEVNQLMFTDVSRYDEVDGEIQFEIWINELAIERKQTTFEYLRNIVERKIRG